MCKCASCEFGSTCELASVIHFCEDCIHFDTCDILATCDAGEYIECNNGFEPLDEED